MIENIISTLSGGNLDNDQYYKLLMTVFDTVKSPIHVLKTVRNLESRIIDFRYILVNKAARLSSGRTDMEGQSFVVEYPFAKKTGLFTRLIKVVETNNTLEETIQFTGTDGTQGSCDITVQRFEDGVVICREVDMQKSPVSQSETGNSKNYPGETDSNLRKVNHELEIQNAGLKAFNSIVAGEYRETLRNLYTSLEYIVTKDGSKLSDSAKANLRRTQSAVQKMNLLVLDIIAYAELYNFSESSSVNLHDIVNRTFREFNEQFPDAHAKFDCDHLPVINGQVPLLKLLFHHLTGNSFKFRNERIRLQISVRISRISGAHISHPDALAGTWYHIISFSDNGIGFEQQLASKVFTMFYRLHDKGKYHGTGTGLPVCKKIMETHNGFMTIESVVDVGTNVHCFFPVENE